MLGTYLMCLNTLLLLIKTIIHELVTRLKDYPCTSNDGNYVRHRLSHNEKARDAGRGRYAGCPTQANLLQIYCK